MYHPHKFLLLDIVSHHSFCCLFLFLSLCHLFHVVVFFPSFLVLPVPLFLTNISLSSVPYISHYFFSRLLPFSCCIIPLSVLLSSLLFSSVVSSCVFAHLLYSCLFLTALYFPSLSLYCIIIYSCVLVSYLLVYFVSSFLVVFSVPLFSLLFLSLPFCLLYCFCFSFPISL